MGTAYIKTVLALILSMSPLTTSRPVPEVNKTGRHMLAQMVQGEGWHLLGDGRVVAGVGLVHCALNGLDDTMSARMEQFHGYNMLIEPTPEDFEIVDAALAVYGAYDFTQGATYCVSWHDLDTFDKLHKTSEATLGVRNGIWGLYFFTEYPLGE